MPFTGKDFSPAGLLTADQLFWCIFQGFIIYRLILMIQIA